MYKALIVDDETVAIDVLGLMIKRHLPVITEIRTADSAIKARGILAHYTPDLLFLDIEMPYENGFQLLKSIKEKSFAIIFTTAYDKYALQAIKFSALDYLLKPIDTDELKDTFDRFLQKRKLYENGVATVENLLFNLGQEDKSFHKLALPTNNGTQFFKPQEIIRCQGSINYTKFYFSKLPPLVIAKTIKEYEEILSPHQFVRVHKSHLINSAYVSGYDSLNAKLVMTDGSQVDISRRRKKEVLEQLGIKNT